MAPLTLAVLARGTLVLGPFCNVPGCFTGRGSPGMSVEGRLPPKQRTLAVASGGRVEKIRQKPPPESTG